MPETTYKKTVKLILWIAGTILLLYLLYLLADVIIILALSVLLAFIFAPVVFMLEQRGFSRLSSTFIAFAALAILIYLTRAFGISDINLFSHVACYSHYAVGFFCIGVIVNNWNTFITSFTNP